VSSQGLVEAQKKVPPNPFIEGVIKRLRLSIVLHVER
jgi:hypothetical protein